MKSPTGRILLASATALLLGATLAAPAQAQVGVSISLGQPGFYGRIDLGDAPRPRLLYRQPVIIERGHERSEPIYLRVPPGHARNWRRHCREYDACGQSVYFVRNDWYSDVYVPHYRDTHDEHGNHRDNRDNHDNRGHNRHDSRDDRNDGHHDRNNHRDGDSRGDTEQRFS